MQDLISRQAVIILIDEASEMHPYKVIGDSDTYSNYNQGWSDACDWLYANIEGVPSVTPKQKMGRWILEEVKDEDGRPYDIKYFCSECQAERPPIWDDYCSACGAKMLQAVSEEQESENQ